MKILCKRTLSIWSMKLIFKALEGSATVNDIQRLPQVKRLKKRNIFAIKQSFHFNLKCSGLLFQRYGHHYKVIWLVVEAMHENEGDDTVRSKVHTVQKQMVDSKLDRSWNITTLSPWFLVWLTAISSHMSMILNIND